MMACVRMFDDFITIRGWVSPVGFDTDKCAGVGLLDLHNLRFRTTFDEFK